MDVYVDVIVVVFVDVSVVSGTMAVVGGLEEGVETTLEGLPVGTEVDEKAGQETRLPICYFYTIDRLCVMLTITRIDLGLNILRHNIGVTVLVQKALLCIIEIGVKSVNHHCLRTSNVAQKYTKLTLGKGNPEPHYSVGQILVKYPLVSENNKTHEPHPWAFATSARHSIGHSVLVFIGLARGELVDMEVAVLE